MPETLSPGVDVKKDQDFVADANAPREKGKVEMEKELSNAELSRALRGKLISIDMDGTITVANSLSDLMKNNTDRIEAN